MRILFVSLALISACIRLNAQEQKLPYFNFTKGIGICAPDSSFSLNIKGRIQNRVAGTFAQNAENDWTLMNTEMRTRRARLRIDGFIFNPKFTYTMQLSFSRSDIDWDNTGVPNILRDAMFAYKPNSKWTFSLGQGKIPTNHQRIISSGDLQFAERSLLSTNFTVDRDFGGQVAYRNKIKNFEYLLRGAVGTGEGRNEGIDAYNGAKTNTGLSYTGRVELFPLGAFTKGGDMFEGDLLREEKPKLAIGGSYIYNERAVKTLGQLGKALYSPVDMTTYLSDIQFKYRGFSFYGEYVYRTTKQSPITQQIQNNTAVATRYVYTGMGYMAQAGMMLTKTFEVAARYTYLEPTKNIGAMGEDIKTQYTVGVTRYIKGHALKVQGDITYEKVQNGLTGAYKSQNIQPRFQIEIGF